MERGRSTSPWRPSPQAARFSRSPWPVRLHDPHLNVFVNGHQVINQGLGNDQTLYRSCLQGGLFQVLTATVPAADLAVGANAATFDMNTKGTAGAGVYYDIVKLESD